MKTYLHSILLEELHGLFEPQGLLISIAIHVGQESALPAKLIQVCHDYPPSPLDIVVKRSLPLACRALVFEAVCSGYRPVHDIMQTCFEALTLTGFHDLS